MKNMSSEQDKKRRTYTPLRSINFNLKKEVKSPGINDVLCGRGCAIHSYPGNQQFRAIVAFHKPAYKAIENSLKTVIAREVVSFISNQSPPGRFLSPEKSKGVWYEIPHDMAIQKTQQALREKSTRIQNSKNIASLSLRKEMMEKKDSNSSARVSTQGPSHLELTILDKRISDIVGMNLENSYSSGISITTLDDISDHSLSTEPKSENVDIKLNALCTYEPPPSIIRHPQSLCKANSIDQINEIEGAEIDMSPAINSCSNLNMSNHLDDIDLLILSIFWDNQP